MATEAEKKRRAAANRKAQRQKANEKLAAGMKSKSNPFKGGTMKERMDAQIEMARAIRRNKDEQLWEDAYPNDWRERMK